MAWRHTPAYPPWPLSHTSKGCSFPSPRHVQAAYDAAQQRLFSALDDLEARLQGKRFLMGDRLTQADVWLFPTICRFDAVYAGIFR